ncbi:PREDICTED: peripherin-2-like [Trachymyrmex septentrionalis]|uniref:peripherin-2-like n=1 Tax=Trachymyrmex septentrionalis TaxID=34720 RepID=UPI00084F36F3|nr:PREDICTED: peripherin-2-like [Trachymyrmex septentrionalis]XP_018351313.1 PREDICTED: peripherin-2-like [Trachymyrmex septentrionalis]
MTENGLVYRKRVRCTCEWKVKFGYGVAFTLAIFEAKRLLVIALEIFAEWQVIRIAGGFQPVALTLIDIALGLPCALIIVYAIRRRKSNLYSKTRRVLKCLLIMIITCIAMNTTTLALIGYHISVRQETLIDIFNASMHLYTTTASHKFAIDEIQFVLQCCGHSSYTDWFLFDWQKVDYASREEMAQQNRISDENYRGLGVPFSCCNLRATTPCMHLEMTDDKTINVNGCVEIISPILLRIVIVAYVMTITLIIIQVLLAFLITRITRRCVPLRTSFPQICPTVPFTIINASSRTYVPRLLSLKKSVRRKKSSMHHCPSMTKDVFMKENRKSKSSKSKVGCRYPILNHGNHTWDVAKIKPSVHEEHKISVECRHNKCAR